MITALSSAGLLPQDETPWSDAQRRLIDAGEKAVTADLEPVVVARIAQAGSELAAIEAAALIREASVGPEALHREGHRRRALSKLVAATRHGVVSTTMRRLTSLSDPFHEYASEQLHVPSPLFLAQHGFADSEAALRERIDAGDAAAALLLGRLLIGLGRHAEACRWLTRSLLDHVDDAAAYAHLALTQAFLGEPDDARRSADRAMQLAPNRPMSLIFSAVVRAYAAGATEDVFLGSTLVTEALELLERSRAGRVAPDPASPPIHAIFEELEVRITRGRLSVVLPPDFGIHQKGVDDLERAMELTRAGPANSSSLVPRGALDLFRIHAAYFLGMAHADAGRLELARGALHDVLLIDPACPFAERAYRRLSELHQSAR